MYDLYMCSLRTKESDQRVSGNPSIPCVSKMAVIFYLLNSEEPSVSLRQRIALGVIYYRYKSYFHLKNSSSIGLRKLGLINWNIFLLIKHWNCWRRVKEGALARPLWFLSFIKFQTVYIVQHQQGPFSSKGTFPNAGKKHKCYKSSMNIDNLSPFSNVWIFGE